MMKKLMWLIKHQEEIEKMLDGSQSQNESDSYSIAGVPEFQKEYVNDLLNDKLENN